MSHDASHDSGVVADPASPPLVDGVRQIDAYKLLALLGEGGMGVVYLAEQTSPVRRRVALKVLKLGMETEQVVARFESERQALAVMDHPNIAKVLGSGVTPRGRPYFVMEAVRGTPITDYADTHRLSTPERLRLFIDVCRAVQHAHHKGVIHRDLKPSNVLVTVGEAGPTAKVIDFGIAKAVGLGLTQRTLVTRTGQMVGTPEYMSPEQAEMSGLDVDTRTDIYSLGVMLYELVVGALPFDLSAKPDYVISHTLRERDVPRPSTRLTTLGATLDVVARHRRTTADSLRRELKGDLDWIILKAMDKDRTRRYETANGLAVDLERHLSDEPVFARPPTARYRLRKFVRRNRLAVGAASIAFLGVLVGAAAATLGLVEARREQLRAERSAQTAEQVTDFLVDIFRVSDPGEARGNTITAREVLDRGAERIRTDLADQPAVQAQLLRVMGEVYRQLGLYADARELLEGAVATAERAPDPNEAGLPLALRQLGIVYRSQGNVAAAEATLRRALDVGRASGQTETREFANTLRNLGNVYTQLGRYSDAEPLLREALAIQERTLEPEHEDVGLTLGNLGAMYLYQRDLRTSEPYLLRSLAITERTLGRDHPRAGDIWSNLGSLYFMEGKYDEAEDAYTRVHAIWRQTLEADHPRMAYILNNLGETHWALGRYGEAERHLRQALAMKERTLGPDHASLPTTLKALANVYRDEGRLAEAEPLYVRALRIRENSVEGPDAVVQETLENYARLLRLTNRIPEAESMERRAADIAGQRAGS
jgi:eukaryotic-like serine/threonine-protein kinase